MESIDEGGGDESCKIVFMHYLMLFTLPYIVDEQRVNYLGRVQQTVTETITERMRLIIISNGFSYDVVIRIASDDTVDEVSLVQRTESARITIGKIQRRTAQCTERIKLSDSTMDEFMLATIDRYTIAPSVGNLTISDMKVRVVSFDAVPRHIVDDTIADGHQRGRLRRVSTFEEETVGTAVDIAEVHINTYATAPYDDALPLARDTVVRLIGEHVVHPVASETDGGFQSAFGDE